MKNYREMTKEECQKELAVVSARYDALKKGDKKLDMSRGKPNPAQLDLSMAMLAQSPFELITTRKGTDVRNYGELAGVDECKELFADLLGLKQENIIMGGQSSLNLMYDSIVRALLLGVYGGSKPWGQQGQLKFLCPVPGYDRHFAICEEFGIEMINIPMDDNGPDMAMVKEYVESDPSIKGIWCVPKYSNPTGITYSDEVVRAFAALKPAADDFRIFWDNAYLVHGFRDEDDQLLNIFDACKEFGSEDMVYEFISTSKVTFSGAGLAVLAASPNNVKFILKQMGVQTIGYDKINQLRHTLFFGDADGVRAHMKKHAALMAPKFDCVLDNLNKEIAPRGIGSWHEPKGGYFVCYQGLPGTAKRTVALCKEAGLTLTGAGAPFPYKKDPNDNVIRIAPSYPDVPMLEAAMKLFCVAARMAALEVLLAE
ncbi:MAG: aminotransferase class I/II-fold pyridoxal phosphate-dependent enzyme [Lachnospiraceae bacterium]|nr:aminotransferase class I/II-fold pyridoxal phosphate-dependent enzyme [Lachnospiraceae bacterium]